MLRNHVFSTSGAMLFLAVNFYIQGGEFDLNNVSFPVRIPSNDFKECLLQPELLKKKKSL